MVLFVTGVYGVGKSTLCAELSRALSMPAFSAGDLISAVNGEQYGANKVVSDKNANQDILIEAVNRMTETQGPIILAGHFCILTRIMGLISSRIQYLWTWESTKFFCLRPKSNALFKIFQIGIQRRIQRMT